ncbi:MAG: hypothetical protein J6D03_07200 [Clostridia bacterium]|nr:hypothetical protein [Clostridia bacterium]
MHSLKELVAEYPIFNKDIMALPRKSILDIDYDYHDELMDDRGFMFDMFDRWSKNEDTKYYNEMLPCVRYILQKDAIAYTTPDKIISLNYPCSTEVVPDNNDNFMTWYFIYCHECLHQIWDTFEVGEKIRAKGIEYDHELLNIASDCVINDFLSVINKQNKRPPLKGIFPDLIYRDYGVKYDRKVDTQYTLYMKLINLSPEKKNGLKKLKPKEVRIQKTQGGGGPQPPQPQIPDDYKKGRAQAIKDVLAGLVDPKKFSPLPTNVRLKGAMMYATNEAKNSNSDWYNAGYNEAIQEILQGLEQGITKIEPEGPNGGGGGGEGLQPIPWDLEELKKNQAQKAAKDAENSAKEAEKKAKEAQQGVDGDGDVNDDGDGDGNNSNNGNGEGKSGDNDDDNIVDGGGKSGNGGGTDNSKSKNRTSSDRQQRQKEANKAKEAAKKAREAANKAKEAAERGDAKEAEKQAKIASEEMQKACSAADNACGKSAEELAKDAEESAKNAKEAAKNAREAANSKPGNKEAQDAAKAAEDLAADAEKQANAAKDAAKSGNRAKAKASADKARQDEELAKEQQRIAENSQLIQNQGNDDDENELDPVDDNSPQNAGTNPGGIKDAELIKQTRAYAEKIVKKHIQEATGALKDFVNKCKISKQMNNNGMQISTDRGPQSWFKDTIVQAKIFIHQKLHNKKDYKNTYNRMRRGERAFTSADLTSRSRPVLQGREELKNKVGFDLSVFIDASSSMDGVIEHVNAAAQGICQALYKEFSRDSIVDASKIKMRKFAFTTEMREIPFTHSVRTGGGTYDFGDLLNDVKKNAQESFLNIVITDGYFQNINVEKITNGIKQLEGLVILIVNNTDGKYYFDEIQSRCKVVAGSRFRVMYCDPDFSYK